MNFNQEVSDYISKAPENHIEILEILRELIHKSVPETTEAIKWGFPVFGKNKDYVYFKNTKKHVTFGFYNIDRIEDPSQLLEGSGTIMKHVKIKNKEEIKPELFTKWLQAISE